MRAYTEGFRRMSWVASGALTLAWVAVVYANRHDYYFDEALTWIQVFGVAFILIALPHAARHAIIWALRGFSQEQPGSLVAIAPLEDDDRARVNLEAINLVAVEVSSRILSATSGSARADMPLQDALEDVMKPAAVQYALALVQLNRLLQRPDFFNSSENSITKHLVTVQIASSSIEFLKESGIPYEQESLLKKSAESVNAASYAASKFARVIINKQEGVRPNPLTTWFIEAFGIDAVGSMSVDEFTKTMLRYSRSKLNALDA